MPNSHIKVRYSPLPQQFADVDAIFTDLRALVATGDFTLGKPVHDFEQAFAELVDRRFAIGVGSGTDALKLALRAVGVGAGDAVLTCANTFIATVGAIAELGARPVFADCDDSFCLDPALVEAAITPEVKAIIPVHLTGDVCDMDPIVAIARRRNIPIIEDGCQSMLAERDGVAVGAWGEATAFSMHPLKIVNVWGDAGIIVTDDPAIDRCLRLLRNHGLKSRDEIEMLGHNSRLDSVQAVVGLHMMPKARHEAEIRADNAAYYDAQFAAIRGIRIPRRRQHTKHVYLLYMVFAEYRDELYRYCLEKGVEAKIHYPIPLYQQQGLRHLGYAPGDFPVTDCHAREIISFPVDQFLSRDEQDAVVDTVRSFYAGR